MQMGLLSQARGSHVAVTVGRFADLRVVSLGTESCTVLPGVQFVLDVSVCGVLERALIPSFRGLLFGWMDGP